MGGSSSKLERALVDIPEGEHYFGLENFGNTCYANSVLQTLFFCEPFRNALLYWFQHAPSEESSEDSMLTCLAALFQQVNPCASLLESVKKFCNNAKGELLTDSCCHPDHSDHAQGSPM